jgi:hypothetical protein
VSDAAAPTRSASGRAIQAIKRANAPLAPEDSVALRAVTCLAVVAGLAACESVGELSPFTTITAGSAIATGMAFSYLTRRRPLPLVKVLLAIIVTAVFVEFVMHVLGKAEAGNLASVEAPLALLFVWIQVTHSFDVPARRDLLFSIIASAAFVAVASAQAIETSFLVIVMVWLVLCVISLTLSWRSMTGGTSRLPFGTIAFCSALAAFVAALLVVVLPAPHPSRLITLPNALTSRLSLPNAGGLDGGAGGNQPAKPASPSSALGVGGFTGFADDLDTALRGTLGNEVVMRVRATRPGYFEALTYNEWSGTTWLNRTVAGALVPIDGGSPFAVANLQPAVASGGRAQSGAPSASSAQSCSNVSSAGVVSGSEDVQTFYVAEPLANVLVAAPDPTQIWFPSSQLYADLDDGSIRSPIAITPGTVYTVVSASTQQSPAVLSRDRAPISKFAKADPCDLELPHLYPTVQALARQITAHTTTVYGKIEALEHWMRINVKYSTDIPPLLPGQDAVVQFLFHGRIGYCEQISTALAIMLRTLGIPAREATGYVPGSFNPITDLYEIQAKDAHAWVKVDFPGYGWQSFDPTADVPLANPNPGAIIAADVGHLLARLPLAPLGAALGGLLALALALGAWLRRPRSWAERVAKRIERAGASQGVRRLPSETLEEYAGRLSAGRPRDDHRSRRAAATGAGARSSVNGAPWDAAQRDASGASRAGTPAAGELAGSIAVLERAAYGAVEPDRETRRQVERATRRLRRRRQPPSSLS